MQQPLTLVLRAPLRIARLVGRIAHVREMVEKPCAHVDLLIDAGKTGQEVAAFRSLALLVAGVATVVVPDDEEVSTGQQGENLRNEALVQREVSQVPNVVV